MPCWELKDDVATQNHDDSADIVAAARRLIELGTLLSDKSRTLREALTELTADAGVQPARKSFGRLPGR
jgi:hypothetical protein